MENDSYFTIHTAAQLLLPRCGAQAGQTPAGIRALKCIRLYLC